VPRGIENRVAIDMVVGHIQRTSWISLRNIGRAARLGKQVEDEPLSSNVLLMEQTTQVTAINTIIQNPMTDEVDFIFYFDRLATRLVERYGLQSWS
jgi:uridine kinase